MLLAWDIGNTHSVVALFDGEKPLFSWRLSTHSERTADEYAVHLLHLLQSQGINSEHIRSAIISSVVPATLYPLRECMRKYFNLQAYIICEEPNGFPMTVLVDNPSEVGADRLVNAYAARERYGNGCLILDFGTATTLDVVNAEGAYAGGIIAPGINLSMEALHRAAAKLPNVAIEKPQKVIGTNTISAMQSGLFYGYIAMIEGLIIRTLDEMQQECQVIATGGLAGLFSEHSDLISVHDDDLTMRGLQLLNQQRLKRNDK